MLAGRQLSVKSLGAPGLQASHQRRDVRIVNMKPIKTKREIRQELDQQINEFLNHGGAVKEVPRGLSGRENGNAPLVSIFEGQGTENRTPLPDVVAAIEARRKPQAPIHKSLRKPRPRKKVILDDFGQPLRWEWVEE